MTRECNNHGLETEVCVVRIRHKTQTAQHKLNISLNIEMSYMYNRNKYNKAIILMQIVETKYFDRYRINTLT